MPMGILHLRRCIPAFWERGEGNISAKEYKVNLDQCRDEYHELLMQGNISCSQVSASTVLQSFVRHQTVDTIRGGCVQSRNSSNKRSFVSALSESTIAETDPETGRKANDVLDSQTYFEEPVTWDSKVVVPAKQSDDSESYDVIKTYFSAMKRNHLCNQFRYAANLEYYFSEFSEDGILALPTTQATKCRDGVNGSLILSVTYIPFAVNHIQDFDNITSSILLDPISLPLLKPMSAAINEGAFVNPANNSNNLTLVILSKIPSASDVDFFACISRDRKSKGGLGLFCTYMLTSVIIVNPQPIDPTIEADLGHDPNIWNATTQLDFTIVHLPHASESENSQENTPLFSLAQIIKANADATRYLASIGHNIQLYKDPISNIDQMYILYDAVELKDAYNVPTAAFVIVCTLTGLFLIIWVFSEVHYPTVYNSSIYKTIYKELKSNDEAVQMFMHCTHDPLAFNGYHVAPYPGDQPSVAPRTSSQDHQMILHQRPNDTQSQQYELQPLELLGEIPAQSPLLSSRSIAASMPIMSPTTATTSRPLQETQLQPHGSADLDVPPPIHLCPPFKYNIAPTSSDQTRPHGSTTHGEYQNSAPPTMQGTTWIQSPFE